MAVTSNAQPGQSTRFVCRSYMAVVLVPEPPIVDWVADIEQRIKGAGRFLAGSPIVLDLSGLEYVSSAGLRCLMIAARESKSRAGRILVAAMQPVVAEIFQISRFNLVLEVFPTLRDALGSVSPQAVQAFERG